MKRPIAQLTAMIALMLAAMIGLFGASAANAQTFPELTGRVVDAADILEPAEEAALNEKLAAFETRTQRQFVVATVPDLQGYDIESYGYQLGRSWGIGDESRDDGVVLLVAPNERKVRIEVGYGLEPIMTDGMSFLIINQQILPRFKQDDMAGGINAGVDAIMQQLELPPDEAERVAREADAEVAKSGKSAGFEVIFLLVFLFFFVIPLLRGLRGGRRYRGGAPVIIWGGGGGWGGGSGGGGFGGGFGGGGGFSGGGGSFGGGGASGGW